MIYDDGDIHSWYEWFYLFFELVDESLLIMHRIVRNDVE